ncbi:MAG: ABC transporter ATP-binding protein [Bryobacteraceae bacterium]
MAGDLICRCRKRLAHGFTVEADFTIPLDRAPVTVLFGPSGAGKTTLLRLLAGLEKPDAGEIVFRGRTWLDSATGVYLAPGRRRAGIVFQDYALFPHLTVAQNVKFGAPGRPCGDVLRQFGLAEFADRLPRQLSGGEQQRLALARAVAAKPELLLLDEPLSALDLNSRVKLRHELRRMLLAAAVPSLVVTHDRTEAMVLGDFMAVMVDGRLRQIGPVEEVFRRPADRETAVAVGIENVVPAEVESRAHGLLQLRAGRARLECVDRGEGEESRAVLVLIRAEDIALSREASPGSTRNHLRGSVTAVTREGPVARVELECGVPLVALVTAQSVADLDLDAGQTVYAAVKATAIHLLPALRGADS